MTASEQLTRPFRGQPPRSRARRLRVALVGADGAGKSTITEMLERAPLPAPVKRIYMGVNLEASSLMLPTTRMLLAAKRARGGRPDLVAGPGVPGDGPVGAAGWRRVAKEGARLTVWMGEEWLRQAVAARYTRRGYIVVFDRHFFADYYHTDVAPESKPRSAMAGLHGRMLRSAYPRPDLVICLDAPAEVLFARKPEADIAWLEDRRRQYLALRGAVPAFVVVDADRPLDEVYTDVVETIRTHWEAVFS